MARIGITYQDVEKAALQLQGQGQLPTIDRIRNHLGTGSKTTITDHLKRWKAEQTDGQGKLPQELSALVTGLWQRLQAQADTRIQELQVSYDEQLKNLQQSLTQSQQATATLQQQLHHITENAHQQACEKHALEQQLHTQQHVQLQLETRYAAAQQHAEDLKSDNARLHQLAHQVQANLEHYQHAMQSLRAEQTLEIEKREAALQRDIQALQKALSLAKQEASAAQEKNQQQAYALTQAQDTTTALQQKVEDLTQQHQHAHQELAKLTERCTHLTESLRTQHEQADHYQRQANDSEKQILLLTDQKQQLTAALQHAEDKIETLRHEKLFLVQEKAELLGSLKQLQRPKKQEIAD